MAEERFVLDWDLVTQMEQTEEEEEDEEPLERGRKAFHAWRASFGAPCAPGVSPPGRHGRQLDTEQEPPHVESSS